MTMLETPNIRFSCLQDGDQVTGFELATRSGDGWYTVAKTTPLSHLIYQDSNKNRQETDLTASVESADGQQIRLKGTFTDGDDVTWTLKATFALTDSPNRITADYRLEVSDKAKYTRWMGPCLYAGEGSFGGKKDKGLFPGLEFLLDDEPSSDTRFASEKFANRATPHPYKITIPIMAISEGGRACGLLWDPNQPWGRAWRHPSSLFSSPNRLQEGADNHWMALFAPGFNPGWIEEGAIEAHNPFTIDEANPAMLSAQFVAVPDGDVIAVLREWVAAYGLPPPAGCRTRLPRQPRSMRRVISGCGLGRR